ncbi:MAG: substrate-binding domain-containing protein, partial [Rhodospirillales bacterium]|nr:substrate-binding domain-containing protein [Rhodospirillales bacterium]
SRRARIAAAAAALDYHPNPAARRLAARRSLIVATLLPTIESDIFARGTAAIAATLEQAGYTLFIGATGYDQEREFHLARRFLARGADGLIFMGASHLPALYELLERRRVPFVNQGVFAPEGPYPSVGFDNARAAGLAVGHLLALGHRRIGMIAGVSAGNDRAAGRIAGLRARLAEAGLVPTGVVERLYTLAGGADGLNALWDGPARPTAIVCGNDVLALGALFAAARRGIAVPHAVSLIGFDDLAVAEAVPPGLSSIAIPTEDMGRRAAEYLLARLAGEDPPAHQEIPVTLRPRGSTAPPGR